MEKSYLCQCIAVGADFIKSIGIMKKYLDPKADLTFKKIFGEHKDLLISLINALLPLNEDEQVEDVEYLTPELVPDNYVGKNSIVDVRCRDVNKRQFLVEMQMLWTPAFQQRVLFNASKTFVRQLGKKRKFETLQPVYIFLESCQRGVHEGLS